MYAPRRRSSSPQFMPPIEVNPFSTGEASARVLDIQSFGRVTHDLVKLHETGKLKDEELEMLVGIIAAALVERALTTEFDRVVTDSFNRVFGEWRF